METTAHSDASHPKHAEPSLYIKTYIFLIVMMFLTVGISKVQLGPMNNVAALSIALAKAVAVVLLFMQVKFSSRLTWLWASLGFLWLSLMFGILGDYVTRTVLAATAPPWSK